MRAKGNINLSKKDTIRIRLTYNRRIRRQIHRCKKRFSVCCIKKQVLLMPVDFKTFLSCKLSFVPVNRSAYKILIVRQYFLHNVLNILQHHAFKMFFRTGF